MKDLIKRVPVLRSLARVVYVAAMSRIRPFSGSETYWKERYASGGDSGGGSYDRLAEFKAEVLNAFVEERRISTVIEFGCGDGNQLRSSQYPSYLGFDVSPQAIAQCNSMFCDDKTKAFKLMDQYAGETAELTLSLDVIYHLVEENTFVDYMQLLFDSATRYVIVYSSNTDKQAKLQASHVKHRKFSKWIERERPDWSLTRYIPNRYPFNGDDRKSSFADFYIYEKTQ